MTCNIVVVVVIVETSTKVQTDIQESWALPDYKSHIRYKKSQIHQYNELLELSAQNNSCSVHNGIGVQSWIFYKGVRFV